MIYVGFLYRRPEPSPYEWSLALEDTWRLDGILTFSWDWLARECRKGESTTSGKSLLKFSGSMICPRGAAERARYEPSAVT